MNFGLYRRAMREVFWTSIVLGFLSGVFLMILSFALPRVQARFMNDDFIPEPVRQFRNALLGTDGLSDSVGVISYGIAWSHPMVLSLLLAHAIVVCTRLPAGEIERGTADILLALPASRWQLFMSESAAWLTGGAIVLSFMYAGSLAGHSMIAEAYKIDTSRMLPVIANLALVYTLVGSLSWLWATLTDRRTRAVLIVVVLVVLSLLVNFLHTLDPTFAFLKKLNVFSFLQYYQPATVFRTGEWPWKDIAILGLGSLGIWTLAGVILARRDITTT